jgi:hypothetical protein
MSALTKILAEYYCYRSSVACCTLRLALSTGVHSMLVLCGLAIGSIGRADNFDVDIDKSVALWGEPVRVTVSARNPVTGRRWVQGGITVSFSDNVILAGMDSEAKVHHPPSVIMKNPHPTKMRARDIMIENWYRHWPANEYRRMSFRFFPIKTGTLTLRLRAAYIQCVSCTPAKVVNLPAHSRYIDQQDYPVEVSRILVEPSSGTGRWLQLQKLVGESPKLQSYFVKYLQNLLDHPTDRDAWRFLGVNNPVNYMDNLQRVVSNRQLIDSPDFLRHLQALVSDPTDPAATRFFGIPATSSPPIHPPAPTRTPDTVGMARLEAERFLHQQQAGPNLVQLLAAEGDIRYMTPAHSNSIALVYGEHYKEFTKGDHTVYQIAEWVLQVKPDTRYRYEKEPIADASYEDLLRVLR